MELSIEKNVLMLFNRGRKDELCEANNRQVVPGDYIPMY
jgi:hypothetical protein